VQFRDSMIERQFFNAELSAARFQSSNDRFTVKSCMQADIPMISARLSSS
jgi:hypothetical protein